MIEVNRRSRFATQLPSQNKSYTNSFRRWLTPSRNAIKDEVRAAKIAEVLPRLRATRENGGEVRDRDPETAPPRASRSRGRRDQSLPQPRGDHQRLVNDALLTAITPAGVEASLRAVELSQTKDDAAQAVAPSGQACTL